MYSSEVSPLEICFCFHKPQQSLYKKECYLKNNRKDNIKLTNMCEIRKKDNIPETTSKTGYNEMNNS